VDEIVVFHQLSREDIEQIVGVQIELLAERLVDHEMALELTDAGRALLVEEGFDPQFGARPLRRAIQRLIEDPLAEKMLEGAFKDRDTVLIDAQDGEIVLHLPEVAPEPAALLSGEQL